MKKTKIAIFASGTGSNAGKIIEYFRNHKRIEVGLIVSNRKEAGVLEIACSEGIPYMIIDRKYFYGGEKILKQLAGYHIDFIVLAGFLWLIPKYFIRHYKNKIINIHPALLPKYGGKGMYGMNVHKAVKESGDKKTGITIHLVNEYYDEGEIVFQKSISISNNDSPKQIAAKVLKIEHQYFSKVIENFILK